MVIDFYISSLSGGGAEKVMTTLAKTFAENGHNVTIISLEKMPQFYDVDTKVNLVKCNNPYSGVKEKVLDYRNVRRHYKNSKAEVSVSFLSRCNLLLLLCSVFRKSKRIVCDRNNPIKEHGKLMFYITNLIYRKADRIVVQTNQIKSYYSKVLQKKTSVIENPIDNITLEQQLGSEYIEREKVVISIARLKPQKDYKTLIDAAEIVHRRHSEWKFKFFGKGELKDELQEYINNKNLQNCVYLCGLTEKPFLELRKSSIFVLSSYYEGFPNVLCEAMHAGDLCISSDCISGPRELINSGVNGWLFPIGDANVLAEQIEYCIVNENELDKVRESAKSTVRRLYIANNIKTWENVILNTLGGEN